MLFKKSSKRGINFLVIILFFSIFMPGNNNEKKFIVPGSRMEVESSNDVVKIKTESGEIKELKKRKTIKLKFKNFDPLNVDQANAVPMGLSKSNISIVNTKEINTDKELMLIQFETPIFQGYLNKLKELGAEIGNPIPDNAVSVIISKKNISKIQNMNFVRWVGKFEPVYKLQNGLIDVAANDFSPAKRYSILVHQENMQKKVIEFVKKIAGKINLETKSRRFEATLNGKQLRQLVQMNEVAWIDVWTPHEEDMDMVREVEGINLLETLAGYSGEGVRGEVCDDGLLLTHQEFQANPPLLHGGNNADNNHGTSCYGIVFASGVNSKAKGVLPDAEQPIFASHYEYSSRYAHTLQLVDPNYPYKAVFQSNSWGSTRTTEYTSISADLDFIAFKTDLLITQSQSNEGTTDSRPQAWAKNVVSVGGIKGYDTPTRTDDRWANGASIGPASDGRIKPDVSNFFDYVYTTSYEGDNRYKQFSGTSGATPITAGQFGLLFQMWADGAFEGQVGQNRNVFDSRPHASTAKAIIINTAYQYTFSGADHDLTRVHQGWGMPDLKNLYRQAKNNNWHLSLVVNETDILMALQEKTYTVNTDGTDPLKITMVYSDPAGNPAASVDRINDLTLKVISPSGTVYWGNYGLNENMWSLPGGEANHVDNVENVFIYKPEAGTWTIKVIAEEIAVDGHTETAGINDADFALVVTGAYTGSTPPTKYELSLTSENGVVSVYPQTTHFYSGEEVELNAIPNLGYKFVKWSGDYNGTDNPITITMDADKNITAEFESFGLTIGNTEVFSKIGKITSRRAMPFTVTTAGTLNSVSMYHEAGGTGSVIYAIYDGTASTPQNRLATTGVRPINPDKGWQKEMLDQEVIVTAGQTIWIAWVSENDPGVHYASGTPGRVSSGVTWSGGMPENWGPTATQSNWIYSIFASYKEGTSAVESNFAHLPADFKLEECYPNPFNPGTNVRFSLPKASKVEVKIFNVLGQLVKTLIPNAEYSAGKHTFYWNGTDNYNSAVPSGVYFIRMKAGEFVSSKKAMLLK